jgi:filamentous hemagglutinin
VQAGSQCRLTSSVPFFAGIIKAIGSPAETLAGVKAILNDPAFRASVGDALADEYAERVDRMATAYEDAGWDGSVTAGVEVGRLIFDVAGAVEAAGGVAKLGASVATKTGKVIGEVGEAIKSGTLVKSEKGVAAIANASADAEAGTSVAVTNSSATGRYVPNNLKEQLAMQEVVSNPAAGRQLKIIMSDPRWPAEDGWVKMSKNVNGVEIHYTFNTKTGEVLDFKFK